MGYQFKIIILGDGAVGKTALIRRYTTGLFNPEYKMTIGVDFTIKDVEIRTEEGVKPVRLQLWDFEGQERFRFLISTYVAGANGALLAFDLTRRVTLEQIPDWMSIVTNNLEYRIPTLLMGNKVDLEGLREVNRDDAIEFAKKTGFSSYVETSAKTGVNVQESFESLAEQIFKHLMTR